MTIEKLMNNIQAIDENAYLVTIEGGEYVDISECKHENIDAIENMLRDYFEGDGEAIETVYNDNYFYCDHCNKNKWLDNGYTSYMRVVNETAVCTECLENAESDNEELAEYYFDELLNNPHKANKFLSDEYLQEQGLEKVHEYHTCGYYRDNDNINPASVLEREQKRGYDVIFQLCSNNPFETKYTFWKRKVTK